MNAGKLAATRWAEAQGLHPPGHDPWHVEVLVGVGDTPPEPPIAERGDTALRIEIYSEEWGIFFCHGGSSSWIRVTDIAFVHGRDEFRLLSSLPPLAELGRLVQWLERQHAITLRRDHALIRTNIPDAEAKIRAWLTRL